MNTGQNTLRSWLDGSDSPPYLSLPEIPLTSDALPPAGKVEKQFTRRPSTQTLLSQKIKRKQNKRWWTNDSCSPRPHPLPTHANPSQHKLIVCPEMLPNWKIFHLGKYSEGFSSNVSQNGGQMVSTQKYNMGWVLFFLADSWHWLRLETLHHFASSFHIYVHVLIYISST